VPTTGLLRGKIHSIRYFLKGPENPHHFSNFTVEPFNGAATGAEWCNQDVWLGEKMVPLPFGGENCRLYDRPNSSMERTALGKGHEEGIGCTDSNGLF